MPKPKPNNDKPTKIIFDITDAYDNFDYEFDIDEIIDKIKSMKDLKKYNLYDGPYEFGDIVRLSEYRDTETFFVGEKGELIGNPDNSGSGYLTVPFEITKHFDDAIKKFEIDYLEINDIELKYNDKLILDKINTKNCKIKENDNFILSYYFYDNTLEVIFPNGNHNRFDMNGLTANKIKKWYKSSQLKQSKITVEISVKDDDYIRFKKKYKDNYHPKCLTTWSTDYGGGSYGGKNLIERIYYKGPSNETKKVTDMINNFFKDFQQNIKITQINL